MARKKVVVKKNSSLKNKINISWRNFATFAALFLISFLFWNLLSTPLYKNLFALLSIIFGFLSLALLIVLVVFLILKLGKK